MPTGFTCHFPEHHPSSGGRFPWAVAIIAAAGVIVCTSGVFAEVVHDVMVIVLSAVAAVTVAGLGGLALWLHHRRALVRAVAPRPIHLTARLEQRPGVENTPRRAVERLASVQFESPQARKLDTNQTAPRVQLPAVRDQR
jgi:hypothetical protein